MDDGDNLWTAASDGDLGRVRSLLESGTHKTMDPDETGYTVVHAAASYGHLDLLTYLLARSDCDLTAKDHDGDTPLHVCEDPDVATQLLTAGADLSALNNVGLTPVAVAQQEGHEDLAAFLVAKASDAGIDLTPPTSEEPDPKRRR